MKNKWKSTPRVSAPKVPKVPAVRKSYNRKSMLRDNCATAMLHCLNWSLALFVHLDWASLVLVWFWCFRMRFTSAVIVQKSAKFHSLQVLMNEFPQYFPRSWNLCTFCSMTQLSHLQLRRNWINPCSRWKMQKGEWMLRMKLCARHDLNSQRCRQSTVLESFAVLRTILYSWIHIISAESFGA